jgi:transposase
MPRNNTMRSRTPLFAVALVGVTAVVTAEVVSQVKDAPGASQGETTDQKADESPDAESAVDAWVRYAMPGEHHRLLGKLVGEWHLAVKYKMSADTPVVESEGTCRRRWILGNRFVLEEFDAGNLALPFQGLAIYGYDAFEKKYTSAWVDTTSTAVTTSLGTCQQEPCDLITFMGRHGDPWSGLKKPSRGNTRLISEDKHVLELYEPDKDGREFKVLEIVYTRK